MPALGKAFKKTAARGIFHASRGSAEVSTGESSRYVAQDSGSDIPATTGSSHGGSGFGGRF